MNTDAIQWAITILVGPASAVGGWLFARRQREATAEGIELENEGRALGLYEQMGQIADDLQVRLNAALAEVETFRAELRIAIESRDQMKRELADVQQQRLIDKARAEVEISQLRHEMAAMRLQIIAIGGGDGGGE